LSRCLCGEISFLQCLLDGTLIPFCCILGWPVCPPYSLFGHISKISRKLGTLAQTVYGPMNVTAGDTRLEDLALPWGLVLRLELIGIRTLRQLRVLLSMQDKSRAQLVTMLRRAPRQKTNRPGLA
jgi:hypothetical protein